MPEKFKRTSVKDRGQGELNLRVFPFEFSHYGRFLGVSLHVRPVVHLKSAYILLGRRSLPLQVEADSEKLVLSGDFLVEKGSDVLSAQLKLLVKSEHWWANAKKVVLPIYDSGSAKAADDYLRLLGEIRPLISEDLSKMRVLEIGSRRRASTLRALNIDLRSEAHSYIGLDVLGGENVDVVGDAHKASTLLDGKRFDFVYSQFVFEHLAMPWVVVGEMNALMEVGARALLISNQSAGLHDLPYDFWRYSGSAWKALFSETSGFRMLKVALGAPVKIMPYRYNEFCSGITDGVGNCFSAAFIEKVGEVRDCDWRRAAERVLGEFEIDYPLELDS